MADWLKQLAEQANPQTKEATPMTPMPVTNDPFIALAQAMVPTLQSMFNQQHGKPIDISVHKVTDPETQQPRVEFRFTMARPGLLPTALEKTWFTAFIAGFQACHHIAVDLMAPAAEAMN